MRRLVLTVALVTGAVVAVAAPSVAGTADTVGSQLAEVRAATAKYHNIDAALADGFIRGSGCVAIPTGGMGFHYVNPARIDGIASIAEPEVLVYAPMRNGKLQLVAVEYVVPVAGSPTRPTLFGRGFDGPNNVGAPWGAQWDLHAWIWKHNPSGMHAPFNPRVSCP